MTEGRLTANDRSTLTSIEQNADSGNVQGALEEVREYLNQNPNNPQLVSEFTAEMERNGVLPLLMIEAFGSNVDIASELDAYDDNQDGILSRTELVNGAGDNASILFGQLLADRLDLTETGESISNLTARLPQAISEYQSFLPQLSSVELAVGFMTPIQTAEGTVTLFDLIDNSNGGSRDGVISYRDIEHFIYWAEHDPSNGWAQAIIDSGLTIDDIRNLKENYDHPPYNSLRIGSDGDITRDSLLSGSGYDMETGSFCLRDQSGFISEIHYSDGTTRAFRYDANGALTSVVQPDGTTILFDAATNSWQIAGQPYAQEISVTADGQLVIIKESPSPEGGVPTTVIEYVGLDGTSETLESRSILSDAQIQDRAAVIQDNWARGNTDLVITLLTSMTTADLIKLGDYYRSHYGIDLELDGSIPDSERVLVHSALHRVGDSNADFVSAVDHALTLTDTARREEALRNIFSTMSSEQIAELEERWSTQHGGQSLTEYLFSEAVNLSDSTSAALRIYMRGTDANFQSNDDQNNSSQTSEVAGDASTTIYMQDDVAVELATIALQNRNLEMFAEAMRTASPEARAYFAADGDGRSLFLRAFGPANNRANDYVEWGEITLATIIPENANIFWTYSDRISTALINIPEDQRALYARGKELADSHTEATTPEDQRAVAYYTELNRILRDYAHGALAGFNEFTFTQWETQLLYGDSVINSVMSLEVAHTLGIGGTYHDRGAVMRTIETMSREDFERLFIQDADGNYPFRDALLASLDIMLSDDEMAEVRRIIDLKVEAYDQAQQAADAGDTSVDAYELSLEIGRRSLAEVISETADDRPEEIIDGIINMTEAEQELYRNNTYVEGVGNYREYIDGLLRNQLAEGAESQLASLLLRQVIEGSEPVLGPLGRILHAQLVEVPPVQLMADMEAIYNPATLNNEELSQTERDIIGRIQAGENVVIAEGMLPIGRDFFVNLASQTLVRANIYSVYHANYASLAADPTHVLWPLFNPAGNHRLPLDLKLLLAGGDDELVLQAVLNSPLELSESLESGSDDLLNRVLAQIDEEDRAIVESILRGAMATWDGQSELVLAPEDEIRLITLGVWKDAGRIEQILGQLDPTGIIELQSTYSSKYGDIHADVLSFVGEDDDSTYARLDRVLSTRGEFDARETFFNQMFDYLNIRSGLAADALPVQGARDAARMVFDDFAAELSELLGANMTQEQHIEFEESMIEVMNQFSEAKASFTEQLVMAVETIVGIGCAFIPGLQIFSAKVLFSMFIAGGLMRVKMRDWMLGNEYNWDNQGTDFILGGIQMAANVLGPDFIISRLPVFKNVLAGTVDNLAARGIQIAAEHTDDFSRAVVNAIQAGGELTDDAALALVRKIGLRDEAASVIQQVVNGQIAENFTTAGRLATEVLANVGTGGIAGGFTGGLDAALHIPQGADAFEALQHILNSAAMGAASGAGGAIVFTAGFKIVGTLLRGPRGEVVIRPGEDTTVVSADGTPRSPENGVVPVHPGDQILVDGQTVPMDAQPFTQADDPINGELTTANGGRKEFTPEEIIATRGNEFPAVTDNNGNANFLRRAGDYTPEQIAELRDFFFKSEYRIADPELFDQWVARSDEIFGRWNSTARADSALFIARNKADNSLRTSIHQLRRELGDDWPQNLTEDALMDNPAALRDFLNSADAVNIRGRQTHLTNIENATNLRTKVDELLQPRLDELQTYLDQITEEAGLPPVRLQIDNSPNQLGGYIDGVLTIREGFLAGSTDGTSTLLHELLHHNQQVLILWRLADVLNMTSPTPPGWRLRMLVNQYKRMTGLEIDIRDSLLADVLAMRAGDRLTPAQSSLADALIPGWGSRARTGEILSRIRVIDNALNNVRDVQTGGIADGPSAIGYARNYIAANLDQFIAKGFSEDDVSNWTDAEAVAKVFDQLMDEYRVVREQYRVRFNEYAGPTHEWDAQMFGVLAEGSSSGPAGTQAGNIIPDSSSTGGGGRPFAQALDENPDFEFHPSPHNSSSEQLPVFDDAGAQIGVTHLFADGSFENYYDNAVIERFNSEGELVWTRITNDNGNYHVIHTDGPTEIFNADGHLVGRLLLPDENGVRVLTYTDGSHIEKLHPDGTYEIHNLRENWIEFYDADGNLTKTQRPGADGTVEIHYKNGFERTISADIQFEGVRLIDFINESIQPPARAARMKQLLSDMEETLRSRGVPDSQIAILNRETYLILSAGSAQMSMSLRYSLVESMLYNAANVNKIWQGGNMACGFAGVEVRMLVRDPAAYFRALRMAALEGTFSDATGRTIDLREITGALLPDNEAQQIINGNSNGFANLADVTANNKRNFASQVFEVLAGNERIYNMGKKQIKRYEKYNSRPPLPEGDVLNESFERINTYQPIRNEFDEITGYELIHSDPEVMKVGGADIAAIYNQITGARDAFVIMRTGWGAGGPDFTEGLYRVTDAEHLQAAILELKATGQFPVVVQIDAGSSVFKQRQIDVAGGAVSGPHALVIHDIRVDSAGNYVLDATMQWGDDFNFIGDQAVLVTDVWEALESLRM